MVLMTFLLAVIVYVAIAVAFVFYVRRRTRKNMHLCLAIAFVIILPTWDVIIGFLVYYPACFFVPKVAIYETATTDGIYYEGMIDYLSQQQMQRRDGQEFKLVGTGWIANGIEKGYLTIEYMSENKTIYKCTGLEKDNPINKNANAICKVGNAINSIYEVNVITIPLGIAELNFKKIYNRNTGKLLAEYSRAIRWSYYGLMWMPFFNWLDWGWWSREEGSTRCPSSSQDYESFEYRVLMPRK